VIGDLHTNVDLAQFDAADVSAVYPGVLSKILLRQAKPLPVFADGPTERPT
jgi:hypothetical protein